MTTMKQVTPVDECLPKFIRVYRPDTSGDDLAIPVSFNSCLPKSVPKNVTLRSIYGKIWKMAMRKCGRDVEKYVLVNGWKRIVKDENLSGGELLEFDFDGSRCFDFCIYEPRTMCKRLRTSPMQSDEGETRATDEVLVLSDDDGDDDGSDDADYNCANDSDAIVDNDDDYDDDRQYLDDRNNPFFPVTINPKKISQLRIPSKVMKDYGLSFPENVTLEDPLVRTYGSLAKKIKTQLNGSVFIKGFGTIIRRNDVKSKDRMICELKMAGNNNLVHTIKFHIIK